MNEMDGSASVTTTVSGAGASMDAMAPKLDLRADWESSARTLSMLNLTSSDVSGLARVEGDARLEREGVDQAVIAHRVAVGEQRLDRRRSR